MTQRINQGWTSAAALTTRAASDNDESEEIKDVSTTGSS